MDSTESARPVQREQELQLEVVGVRPEADGVVALALRSDDGLPLPVWEPGAHVEVVLGEGLVRHYSLCGEPSDTGTWRIGVLREPAGRGGSAFVHDHVRVGDVIDARGPRNNFRLVDAERYLFIAGGIGITPILAMVRAVAAAGRPWTLVYGGRSRGSMAFVEELAGLDGGELVVRPQDEFGLLDLEAYLGTPDPSTSVYCCGPGPLLDAVEGWCRAWPAGALHVERFAPSARTSPEDPFTVELARSGRRVEVPEFVSMLEALEEAGCEITNSCRAGICGTCETPVLGGIPEHNDDVLTDEERASNTTVMPCVSRSKTDVLVLDL